MFPTIFSMALHGLGKFTGQGSGILCMAIVGGALVPFVQGMLAGIKHQLLQRMCPCAIVGAEPGRALM